MSTGLISDLTDLKELKNCASCGKSREFRCPQCGRNAKMTRVKHNSNTTSEVRKSE